MLTTYVFEFFNLYIPKDEKYYNNEYGIKIIPNEFAEEFEKNRKNLSSKYRYGAWYTADCYIDAKKIEDAKKIANWINFIFSFAQSRNVLFHKYYEKEKGKEHSTVESKFIPIRENHNHDLIYGIFLNASRYDRDISLFVDIALKTLKESTEEKLKLVNNTVYSYLESKNAMVIELQFLINWIALEKLSNDYYKYSDILLFDKSTIEKIKIEQEIFYMNTIHGIKYQNIYQN